MAADLLGQSSEVRLGDIFDLAKNEILVGGLVNINFIFPYIGNFIIPIDVHIFQRGSNHQPGYHGGNGGNFWELIGSNGV